MTIVEMEEGEDEDEETEEEVAAPTLMPQL